MSVFTEKYKVDDLRAEKSIDGVYVVLRHDGTSHHAIEIKTPMEAHMLRDSVNKACDMLLGNDKKGR